MVIVTCVPPAGYEIYRCGWREEERDGKTVRIGLCWSAGATELEDDELSPEQIEMLKNDPGKRVTVRVIPGVKTARKANEEAKEKSKANKGGASKVEAPEPEED